MIKRRLTQRLLQDKVRSCLSTALKKEQDSWLHGDTPELLDQYRFSPLAVDVIQVRQVYR